MKYLLLLILFIGCNDKKVKSKMTKVGHYYIAVYKNETLQDAIMRLDKEGVRLAFVDDWYDGPSKIIANDSLKDVYYRDSFFANFSPVYATDESNHITITDHWCVFKKCPHFVEVKTGGVIEWADTTSGFDYNLETSDMPLRVPVGSGIKLGGIIQYNTAINDTTLKSVWTDGVQLSPKSSKQFDKDTIYIYRDTCTLRGIASGSTMILYADDSGNLTAPTDTIIYRKLKQQ